MVRSLMLAGAILVPPARPAIAPAHHGTSGHVCSLTLPAPAGALPVGTRAARIRRSQGDPGEIIVQLWYPTTTAVSSAAVPYLMEKQLGPALLETGYYQQDSTTISSWACGRLAVAEDAPIRAGKYPLLTLSVGLGVIRANYSLLAMDLASSGFVVAMIESPLAGFMIDGSGHPVTDTSSNGPSAQEHSLRVAQWAVDIAQILAELKAGGHDLQGFSPAIEWSRVAALGHSTGGLVAMEACRVIPAVKACINMDGGTVTPDNEPLAPFVTHGVDKPTLVLRSEPLYSDADLARRNLTRAEWLKRAGAGLTAWDSLAARSRTPIRMAWIAGTGHMSYSDAPFVMPNTITRFGGTIIDPGRCRGIVNDLVLAFLAEVFDQKAGALASTAGRLPEVRLKTFTRS